MTTQVDELFGARPPEPPPPSPLRGLRLQASIAAILILIGPFCFTSVPGSLFAIWVWTRCDETVILVQNGVLAEAERRPAERLRRFAFGLMVWAGITILLQLFLYSLLEIDAIRDQILQLLPTV